MLSTVSRAVLRTYERLIECSCRNVSLGRLGPVGPTLRERAILCTGARHVPSLGLVLVFELNFSELAIIINNDLAMGTLRALRQVSEGHIPGHGQALRRCPPSFSRTHRMTVKAGHPAVSTGVLALVVAGRWDLGDELSCTI